LWRINPCAYKVRSCRTSQFAAAMHNIAKEQYTEQLFSFHASCNSSGDGISQEKTEKECGVGWQECVVSVCRGTLCCMYKLHSLVLACCV